MNTNISTRMGLALAAVSLAWACGADAQQSQRKVVLTNASPQIEIPITNTPASMDNRVLTVECVTNTSGNCAINGSGSPATATFSCGACSTARVGQAVALSWSSQRAEACLAGSSGPAATSWTGAQATSSSSRSLLFTAAGSYSLTLKCFGTGGASSLVTITATVSP